MKHLLSLWKVLAQDMGERCAVDTTLDVKYVESRVGSEGLQFLTVALPELGKAFESWLDQGQVVRTEVPGFARTKARVAPIFMGKLFDLVFQPDGCRAD